MLYSGEAWEYLDFNLSMCGFRDFMNSPVPRTASHLLSIRWMCGGSAARLSQRWHAGMRVASGSLPLQC
ncbi:hypothetical protein BN2476_640068 [Paraburkholderia piptadeniae]|uniref:Uncharacterized protein n=1 Tax=Paraburkholderia piptadeniae TaxID=1701573 RepID=A0A1N7SMA8_9BURK|nr:hypothetical protein BN2476_640068 [Paraburkholderia piptadeniae]